MKEIIINEIHKITKLSKKEIENLIEIPPSQEMGDYAFPCFILSKTLKKNPVQIAENLKKKIKSKEFEKIETKGPYLNFFIDKKNLILQVIKNSQKKDFGKLNLGKAQKALIEHTSINPNASPHVGRARNAIIGDSLVRILRFMNFKPEVHYYVNDVSKQIAMLVLAGADKLKFEEMLKKYIEISAKVKKSKKLEKEVFDLLNKLEKGDKQVTKKFRKVTETCVKGQEKILSELGIKYDYFDYESEYLKDANKIISKLKKVKKVFEDEEGRMILDLKNTPIENQMKSPVMVLTRNDKTGLYPLRDISYTLFKMKKAKKNLIVLGEDQKLYFQQLKQALKFLDSDSPEIVHYSFILLNEKGNSKKMSTRKGDVILLEDFLKNSIEKAQKEINKRKSSGDAKKVGIGAVKYAIIKNNNNRLIQFNLNDALNFEGDTGPYLLYSYARANSILKKVKSTNKIKIKNLHPNEIKLTKKLSLFPEIILKSYKDLNPSHIANYSYQLAQTFNEFYHSCPVINSENESLRIELVKSFKKILHSSLNLLGIETLEKM